MTKSIRQFVKLVQLSAYISCGAPVDALFHAAEMLEYDRLSILSTDSSTDS